MIILDMIRRACCKTYVSVAETDRQTDRNIYLTKMLQIVIWQIECNKRLGDAHSWLTNTLQSLSWEPHNSINSFNLMTAYVNEKWLR